MKSVSLSEFNLNTDKMTSCMVFQFGSIFPAVTISDVLLKDVVISCNAGTAGTAGTNGGVIVRLRERPGITQIALWSERWEDRHWEANGISIGQLTFHAWPSNLHDQMTETYLVLLRERYPRAQILLVYFDHSLGEIADIDPLPYGAAETRHDAAKAVLTNMVAGYADSVISILHFEDGAMRISQCDEG